MKKAKEEIAKKIEDIVNKIPKAVTRISFILLWLLILLLIYLIIKRYTRLRDDMKGYKELEDKMAELEGRKEEAKNLNFVDKFINRTAISLVNKSLKKFEKNK